MTSPSQPPLPADLTVRTLLRWAVTYLQDAQVASPASEARYLLAEATGWDSTQMVLHLSEEISAEAFSTLRGWLERRATREPLQHIVGKAPFLDFTVEVGEGVFIPRPETELLAQWAAEQATELLHRTIEGKPLHILDLCSGSGVLAIALQREVPAASVWAVEYSQRALPFLRRNVASLAPRVSVIAGDATLPHQSWGIPHHSVQLVVCNPPYVPEGSLVDVETACFDPADAVFSGVDGLQLSRDVLAHLPILLAPGALVAMEHDDATGEALCQLCDEAGYSNCNDHVDLAGRPRFVTAHWPGC